MNPNYRNNGTARDVRPGTKRRRRREAVKDALLLRLYRDTPEIPPTRQQIRKSARTLAKLEAHEAWRTMRQNRRRQMRLRRRKEAGKDE